MQLDERNVGEVTVVVVTGEITLTRDGDAPLRDKVLELMNQGRRKLVLDLGGVTYVDSSGLGQLVQVQTKAANGGAVMKVARPSTRVLTLLRMAKLLPLFDIHESEDLALAALNQTA